MRPGDGEAIFKATVVGALVAGIAFVVTLPFNWSLQSVTIVGIVAGIVANIYFTPNEKRRRELVVTKRQQTLGAATNGFREVLIARAYADSPAGHRDVQLDAAILAVHGYRVVGQSSQGSHINVGRTLAAAELTRGLSLLAGGLSRSPGLITITFERG